MNESLMGMWIMGHQIHKSAKYETSERGVRIKHTFHRKNVFKLPPKRYMLVGERFLPKGRTRWPNTADAEWKSKGATHCLLGVESSSKNPVWIELDSAVFFDGELEGQKVKDFLWATRTEQQAALKQVVEDLLHGIYLWDYTVLDAGTIHELTEVSGYDTTGLVDDGGRPFVFLHTMGVINELPQSVLDAQEARG